MIKLPNDCTREVIDAERNARGDSIKIDTGDALATLIDHTGDQRALSITLDWASQIRTLDETIEWGESIMLAMTLYFG